MSFQNANEGDTHREQSRHFFLEDMSEQLKTWTKEGRLVDQRVDRTWDFHFSLNQKQSVISPKAANQF